MLFGFKEVELKPGESLLKKIKLEDIWYFDDEYIGKILKYMQSVAKELSKTRYAQRAEKLKNDILGKIEKLKEKQEAVIDAAPQKHIAVYRENLRIIEDVKDDIKVLDRLLIQSREVLGVNLARKLTVQTTWRVILLTASLLTLLSIIFFFIWRYQMSLAQREPSMDEEETFYTPEQRKGE